MNMRMGRPRNKGTKDLPTGLYRRKSGIFYTKHPVTGIQASFETRDPVAAKKLFNDLKNSWREAELDAQAERIAVRIRAMTGVKPSLTLANYAEQYRLKKLDIATGKKGKPLADKTKKDYCAMLKNSIEIAPQFNVAIERTDVVAVRKYLSPWLANPSMYNDRMAILSRLFKAAVDEGVITQNPMREVERRSIVQRDVYIPDDHYILITAKLADWEAKACDLLYLVSHRPTDVLGLQENNITDSNIIFTANKNDQDMVIEMNNDLVGILDWFRNWKRKQNILSPHFVVYPLSSRRNRIGKPITCDYLSRKFARAIVDAGIVKATYTLRDIRPKGLSDEFAIAGDSDKCGDKTLVMKDYYRRIRLPMRAKNNLHLLSRQASK